MLIPLPPSKIGGNDSFTKVLLHFDGTNAATEMLDCAASGRTTAGSIRTWTANGNAQIATAAKEFGVSALLLDGTGDYIDTADSADFTAGSGDFTVDFWFNVQGGSGTVRYAFGQSDNAGTATTNSLYAFLNTSNQFAARAVTGSSATTVTGTTAFSATGWHHFAFVRTGNTLKLFLDGTQEGGDTAFTTTVNDSANKLSIGRLGELAGNEWNGYIDEFRLSIGTARWTANFTPLTRAYS